MTNKEELCSTQPISYLEENVNVDTLKNVEVNKVTQVEEYWSKTAEGLKVHQIELEIIIALDEEENDMKIEVISDRPDEPQKESEEDQPLEWYVMFDEHWRLEHPLSFVRQGSE
ncbi:hypothetical protein Syun_001540 [Stephania yunnanensis]|uniref:Uncharacterized protein n=1 Tax=Stephania yunnanensis TaxID=152371 RepID=A0AAP0LEY0_9MAGN